MAGKSSAKMLLLVHLAGFASFGASLPTIATPAPDPGILTSPSRAYALPMSPYYPASTRPAGMVLRVSINGGKPLRLIFDTGAKGVTIRSRAAEKLGLEFVGASLIRGIGSGEPAKARIAVAQSLEIEDLRMRNCQIEVADSLPAGDADGVIGAIVFREFLIRFNARDKRLELSPLPEAMPSGFTRAFQSGHLLLLPTRINREQSGYFALDTGAAFSSLSSDLARSFGLDRGAAPIYGLNGRVHGPVRVKPVQLQFAREPILDPDAIAFDLGQMSRQEGVEISGLIGYSSLSRGVLTIDYRDGLVDFARQ
jgi:predicted aspartyl protease